MWQRTRVCFSHGVNAANETLLKSQCFGVTTWVHSRHVYRRLCSGDGTKFVDDYVKLA